jgi:hypothetical protein
MFGYDNLMNFFRTNFNLIHIHKYSLSDIENMVPWERLLYIDLLKQKIHDDAEAAKEAAMQSRTIRK